MQISQEVGFINQDYRQKYCKILKRDRALTPHGPTPPLTPHKKGQPQEKAEKEQQRESHTKDKKSKRDVI